MRLTLRTMLAYIDEILEPDDAADIGKKIEESEFATNLMHRLRDSTRRVRLGAPAVLGKGLALDPNTVAEYLDNTLESDRVAEFEKICLESDTHLAEVAACHEVLTLVLGEPAQVDPAAREHMYQLVNTPHARPAATERDGNDAARPPVAARTAPPPVTSIEPPPVARARKREKPEIPEYLRSGRRSPWWAIAAVLLIGALVAGGFALAAPDKMKSLVASLTGKSTQPELDRAVDRRPAETPMDFPASDERKRPVSAVDDMQADERPALIDSQDATPTVVADDGQRVRFPANSDTDTDEAPGDAAPAPGDADVADSQQMPPAPDELLTNPGVGTESVAADAADATAPAPDAVDAAPAVDGSVETGDELGRYSALAGPSVLLRVDRKSGQWHRLPLKATLGAGDHLLSLPSYRSSVSLGTGVSIEPVGAAEFELEGPDERGVPGVKIVFGRLNLLTLGKAGSTLRVSVGEHQGTLVFSSPESTAAIEVRRILPAGADPEQQAAAVAADLYATTGAIVWDEQGSKAPLQGPDTLPLTDLRAADVKPGEFPRWITSEVISDFVKRGSVDVEKAISTDRPVLLSLRELSEKQREEIRSLAMQSAAYAGDFEPIVESLNDTGLMLIETTVTARLEAVLTALARSPQTAAALRQAIEKEYGDEGKELYRMLWGYTAEQLEAGEAKKLVGYLEHEALPYRALASLTLKTTTNLQIKYRPTDPPAGRRTAVKQWKDKLKEGKIVPAGSRPLKTTSRTRAGAPG